MARLLIQTEGGPPESKELNWGITRVGRGNDNDIVITHPSVSYHHCEFELSLDLLVLRDVGSTNGTFVNDQKIQEVRVQPGQRIRFGQVLSTVEWVRESVVVPTIEVPRVPTSVPLGNDRMSCRNHQAVLSIWHCPKCAQYFCVNCTRGVNLVGRPIHRLCPLCGQEVVLAPWSDQRPQKRTLWGKVKKAFSRTMRVR